MGPGETPPFPPISTGLFSRMRAYPCCPKHIGLCLIWKLAGRSLGSNCCICLLWFKAVFIRSRCVHYSCYSELVFVRSVVVQHARTGFALRRKRRSERCIITASGCRPIIVSPTLHSTMNGRRVSVSVCSISCHRGALHLSCRGRRYGDSCSVASRTATSGGGITRSLTTESH